MSTETWISMDPDPDYYVCTKNGQATIKLGGHHWSLKVARDDMRMIQKLNPSLEMFIVKETKKRKIIKTKKS